MTNFNKDTREDTTVLLWDNLYRVKVPQLALRSEEDLRYFGTRITGDKGIDRELANQYTDVMIPIVKMVEYHDDGVPVRILREEDVKTIYDHIQKHIEYWAQNVQHNFNIGNVPYKDLIKMNNFAKAIFAHAKVHYMNNDSGSDFFRYLDTLTHASNIQPKPETMGVSELEKKMKETTRPDFTDVFTRLADSDRNKRWN